MHVSKNGCTYRLVAHGAHTEGRRTEGAQCESDPLCGWWQLDADEAATWMISSCISGSTLSPLRGLEAKLFACTSRYLPGGPSRTGGGGVIYQHLIIEHISAGEQSLIYLRAPVSVSNEPHAPA